MATSAIAGYNGHVYIYINGSYTKMCELRDVTLTVARDTLDVTSHCSSGWKETILGNAQWSASADTLYVQSDGSQVAVWESLITPGPDLQFRFMPRGDSAITGDDMWVGIGVITSWELSLPNDDAAAVSIEIQGKGILEKVAYGG